MFHPSASSMFIEKTLWSADAGEPEIVNKANNVSVSPMLIVTFELHSSSNKFIARPFSSC